MFNQMNYVVDGLLVEDIKTATEILEKISEFVRQKKLPKEFYNHVLTLAERTFWLGAKTEGDYNCPFIQRLRDAQK